MLKQEKITINNKELLHTYSDNNKYILQVETSNIYDEAYDVIPCRYTYTETKKEIIIEEEKYLNELGE